MGCKCYNALHSLLAPEYFDDAAEKENVEENDEEGGDGEEEDAGAVVHPTVDRVITVPDRDDLDRNVFMFTYHMQLWLYLSCVHICMYLEVM